MILITEFNWQSILKLNLLTMSFPNTISTKGNVWVHSCLYVSAKNEALRFITNHLFCSQAILAECMIEYVLTDIKKP